jgi:N-acetyl-anhydromuramyl-L-alanine amidase AmpD
MLTINNGIVINPRIERRFNGKPSYVTRPNRPKMVTVRGIVVHQTDTMTATEAFNTLFGVNSHVYHFLIDKDGIIYQTFSLEYQATHVGNIHSRCIRELTCTETELPILRELYEEHWLHASKINALERKKSHPVRYPSNVDSIGIECVGKAWKYDKQGNVLENQKKTVPDKQIVFEPLTLEQKESLEWLIWVLSLYFEVPMREVFRHPELSWKNETEAISSKEIIDRLRKEEAENAAKTATEATQ